MLPQPMSADELDIRAPKPFRVTAQPQKISRLDECSPIYLALPDVLQQARTYHESKLTVKPDLHCVSPLIYLRGFLSRNVLAARGSGRSASARFMTSSSCS